MPRFSSRLRSIVTAEASLLLSQVSDLQRAGRPVTALCVGEPDFETPDAVRAAAKRAIDAGRTKYAPLAGIHELREAAQQVRTRVL